MDEIRDDQADPQGAAEELLQTITGFRQRSEDLFRAQRDRIERMEQTLSLLQELGLSFTGPAAGAAADNDELEEQKQSLANALREQEELRGQLAQARKLLNARAEELKELRGQLADASSSQDDAVDVSELLDELAAVKTERDQLAGQLAEAERQLEEALASSSDADQLDELRRRFEMAVQEVRELKTRNDELQQELDNAVLAAPATLPSSAPESTGDSFDWEQQKQQLLEQLDTNFDAGNAMAADDRLTVESTIRITDEVVAEKEREIAELRTLLADQSGNIGEVAVGAAAIADILDQDDLIQSERENLKELQQEWEEKLRQAEVDLSVERAKLGRERLELEERVRTFEAEQKAHGPTRGDTTAGGKKSRRWLAQLGIREDDADA